MDSKYLLFNGDLTRFALPITSVLEILRPLPIESMPNAPAFVAGVMIVRGQPIPVIELGLLMRNHPLETIKRLIVIQLAEHRRAGLLVSDVFGLRDGAELALDSTPALASGFEAGVIQSLGQLDSTLLAVLELGLILPDSVWDSIQRSELAQ